MERLLRGTVLALLSAVAFAYPLLAPAPHRIDADHFRLIAMDMTQADVEAIFGVPAGSYDWAVADDNSPMMLWLALLELERVYVEVDEKGVRRVHRIPYRETRTWTSRHGAFYLTLDDQGRVVRKGHLGQTHIEYPWKRWWGKLTGNK